MRASATAKRERLVEGLHGAVDLGGRDVAGDLDGGGGDDRAVDARRLERLEGLRCDTGVTLHSRSDETHLPEVVARAPRHSEAVERLRRVLAVLDGSREDDLV